MKNEHESSGGATLDERIERGLRELASWPPAGASDSDGEPRWRRALDGEGLANSEGESREPGARRRMWANASRPIPRRTLAIAATVMLLLTGSLLILPNLGRARSVPRATVERGVVTLGAVADANREDAVASDQMFKDKSLGFATGEIYAGTKLQLLDANIAEKRFDPVDRGAPSDVGAAARQVARNGSISLEVDDVGATMSRVAALASEAHSEFVERSTLIGEGKEARAEVVLRVGSARLDTVLASLRAMGSVTAESVNAEDVTAQVVDVEARLHNERRVEIELLDLLETRKDAPLREVLDLRDKLREVRSEIERMQASRDRLSRLVALSTLTVAIRAVPEEVEEEPGESGFFEPLGKAIAASWRDGLSGLTGSVAWLIRVAVGGVLWWGVVVGAIVLWRRLGRVRHLPA